MIYNLVLKLHKNVIKLNNKKHNFLLHFTLIMIDMIICKISFVSNYLNITEILK